MQERADREDSGAAAGEIEIVSCSSPVSPLPATEEEEGDRLPLIPPSSFLALGFRMASPPVVRFPIVFLIRLLGAAAAAMVIAWAVRFRGGMALFSDNKDHIFNVNPLGALLPPLHFLRPVV